MKIYTKTGDGGSTSLAGGERVGKDDPRVEAYGTVDELAAVVACLRDGMDTTVVWMEEYRDDLRTILNTLMEVEAALASCGTGAGTESETGAGTGKNVSVAESQVSFLEGRIDFINATLTPVMRFTIPGGHPLVSLSHVCRTVCRRAERRAVSVSHEFEVEPNVLRYLNRLSDYLYQLGRKLSEELNIAEEYWTPGE